MCSRLWFMLKAALPLKSTYKCIRKKNNLPLPSHVHSTWTKAEVPVKPGQKAPYILHLTSDCPILSPLQPGKGVDLCLTQ